MQNGGAALDRRGPSGHSQPVRYFWNDVPRMTPTPPSDHTETQPPRVLGVILAGGQSSRFGSDKAEALLGNKRLIEHVRDCLAPQAARVIVAGGPTRKGMQQVPDRPGPDLGPLGGLNAALHAAAENGFDWVLTAPCDAARLPADLLARLWHGRGAALAAYAHADGRDHPTFGLWSTQLLPSLEAWLAASQTPRDRAIRRWAASVGAVSVEFPDGAFANINTPEDLAALTRPD